VGKVCNGVRVAQRAWPLALCVLQLMLPAQGCTAPDFADDDDRDGTIEESEAHDAAPGELEDAKARVGSDAAAEESDAGNDTAAGMLDGSTSPATDAASSDVVTVANDAAQGTDPGSDASVASTLPSWALPLIGTYAKRSVTLSYDDGPLVLGYPAINTRNVELSVLTISQRGNELEASQQLCAFEVVATDGTRFYLKNPAGVPKLTGSIRLAAPDTFSSDTMVQNLGFDPERGSSCGTSGRRMRYPDQTWSSAMCECRASALPDGLNDCRVVDGDSDSRAGITGRGQFLSSAFSDVLFVFQYSTTFVDGQIKADRAHELKERRTMGQECVNASIDYCGFGNNTLCPGESTTKLIHQEVVTCASLSEAEFGALPPFPSPVRDCR
jgi:hypothetical protein